MFAGAGNQCRARSRLQWWKFTPSAGEPQYGGRFTDIESGASGSFNAMTFHRAETTIRNSQP
jgi:hypothetical protein